MIAYEKIISDLENAKDPKRAEGAARYFKTGKGQYGEGDIFIGISVPKQREIVKKYYEDLSLAETAKLLSSKEHEYRLTALLILVKKFQSSSEGERLKIYELYLKNIKYINNWDLVDSSASYIVGPQIGIKGPKILDPLIKSDNIWERRIAMLACFDLIRLGKPELPLEVADRLSNDKEDLMHKAVGWMLREIGKNCGQDVLSNWLKEHDRYESLPRTMLRYAIEKYPQDIRKQYLQGKV